DSGELKACCALRDFYLALETDHSRAVSDAYAKYETAQKTVREKLQKIGYLTEVPFGEVGYVPPLVITIHPDVRNSQNIYETVRNFSRLDNRLQVETRIEQLEAKMETVKTQALKPSIARQILRKFKKAS